jgi:aminoglycoside phosphotransferase (APT) family kinase protein
MFPNHEEKSGWKIAAPPPPLSVAAVDELLAGWRGSRRVADVIPLEGGLMNRNYRIRFRDSPEAFILRFFDRDPTACAKETAVLGLVRGKVPVPEVLHVQTDGRDEFPPFVVARFVDGISLRALKRRGDRQSIAEAAYDAGRVLARIAQHEFNRAGLLTSTLAIDSTAFESTTMSGLVDHFSQLPVFQRRIDAELRERVQEWARSTDERFGESPGASLVHGDFNSPNILVREEAGRWVVAAILDWEFAFAGPVWCDVGNMLRYERPDRPRFEPFFSRGCADGGLRMADGWRERARLADLPALCELLSREAIPEAVVDELRGLISATVCSEGT